MARKIKSGSSSPAKPTGTGIDNIDIIYADKLDKNTLLVTSARTADELFDRAVAEYDPKNQMYSAILADTGSANTLTLDRISELGQNAQNNLTNIIEINNIVRQYVNTNDLIGMVVQSVTNNINAEFRLSYSNFDGQRNKTRMLERTKKLIDEFIEEVDLRQVIVEAIQNTYLEGNYTAVCRQDQNDKTKWQIEYLPLSVIENSGYEENGNPVILVNINNLKNALNKTMIKKRNGEYLFFANVNEEIKANFPPEVYEAVEARDTYAVLDPNFTGMARINNFGRKYGLTPIFRALAPILILDDYQNADSSTAKAKSKKIIHQKMRKECLGPTGDRKAFEEMAFAHSQLMQAWQNNTVIATTGPFVESISYVEPKTDDIPQEKINIYRNKVLSSLGVAFLAADRSQTASTANINLDQLLKEVNHISTQVERMCERWFKAVLKANNIDEQYAPHIKIIDSELLDMNMRIELSKLLYASYGCSRDTAFSLLGLDVESESVKRQKENEEGYDDVFMPYNTSYNTGGYVTDPTPPSDNDDGAGRPRTNEDEDKQAYDDAYNSGE